MQIDLAIVKCQQSAHNYELEMQCVTINKEHETI